MRWLLGARFQPGKHRPDMGSYPCSLGLFYQSHLGPWSSHRSRFLIQTRSALQRPSFRPDDQDGPLREGWLPGRAMRVCYLWESAGPGMPDKAAAIESSTPCKGLGDEKRLSGSYPRKMAFTDGTIPHRLTCDHADLCCSRVRRPTAPDAQFGDGFLSGAGAAAEAPPGRCPSRP